MNQELLLDCISRCSGEAGNTGIFVDFDNIYYGLKEYGADPEMEEYNIFSLMEQIYGLDRIRTMRAYADFDQVHVSLKLLQEKRVQIRNVYGNGPEEENRKNASDIELSIDAMDICSRNASLDTFVFLTSDSDMIPIMSRLLYRGKKIHLFCIDDNTSHYRDLNKYCHVKCDLLSLFEINPERKNPSFWRDMALREIADWYDRRKNDDMMLGGKWLNNLLCEKFMLSAKAASRLITHLEENGLIWEAKSSAGYTGYWFPGCNAKVLKIEEENEEKD